DVFGNPVARVTYRNHPFERTSRLFYIPFMREVLENAGAKTFLAQGSPVRTFVAPCNPGLLGPPSTRHVMGTLRMGADPATSVTDPGGRFHDVDNLWACDGSVFPTSSGYNPTLTIIAVALRIAHGIVGTQPVLA